MKITESEIVAEIRRVMGTPSAEEGQTGREVAVAAGVGYDAAKRQIKALLAAGRLRIVKLSRTRMDGQRTTTTGYQWVKK